MTVVLTGADLSLADLVKVAREGERVEIGRAALALLIVFCISFGLCFAALRSRVRQR